MDTNKQNEVLWNIDWDQYRQIKTLELKCFYYDIDGKESWNDNLWINGLKEIVGEKLVNEAIENGAIIHCKDSNSR